jgi:polysaccharide export outer membrane protein
VVKAWQLAGGEIPDVCDLSTGSERRSAAGQCCARLLAKMTIDFSTSMRWSSVKFVQGWIFSFLLLVIFAPEIAPQYAQAQATSGTVENATAPSVTAVPATEASASASTRAGSSLRLGAGDLVEVGVYNVPELATKARVSSKGEIYLPLIDYVHVAGLTAEEASDLIQRRLSDGGFVKNPHVTLFVDQYASQGASILGEVTRPGVYPVPGQQRLFDLVSAAGGLTEKAGRSITVTHREQPDKPITVPLSRNASDNPESNIPILPGDTIIVRKADLVYVVGDVGRPSGFLMDSGHLTVLQAIALAGGTTRTANLGGARIIRKGPAGITETLVELKKILRAKAPDLAMQADDILFVPTSATKAFAGRTFEAAMQAATAASIVAVP